MNTVRLQSSDIDISFCIGSGNPLTIIVGPCVIESREMIDFHAKEVIRMREKFPMFNFVFKSSYDKANRTSALNYRGVGMKDGLDILKSVRDEFKIPVITDVHTAEDVASVARAVDIIQIPAFLCRQTDLLQAAGACNKLVLIKKGQFLHPSDMQFAASKVIEAGSASQVMLCERGSCFGYRDLVVDFRGFSIMREAGYPVVFDVTHSVQQMGGNHGKSGGNRAYVPALARAGVAFGVDALFLECHVDPDNAPSDGPNMLTFDGLEVLLSEISDFKRY